MIGNSFYRYQPNIGIAIKKSLGYLLNTQYDIFRNLASIFHKVENKKCILQFIYILIIKLLVLDLISFTVVLKAIYYSINFINASNFQTSKIVGFKMWVSYQFFEN